VNNALRQSIKGFKNLIDVDPQKIVYAVRTDPTDPWSPTTNTEFTGRIAHERATVAKDSGTPSGVSTNLLKFLSYPHDVGELLEDQTITDEAGKKWTLGKSSPLRIAGGIYGYQVPLTEVSP
jgi:hypothetical protein